MSELIQFDGRTVAVIAPEDLEELEAKIERLRGLLYQSELERLSAVLSGHAAQEEAKSLRELIAEAVRDFHGGPVLFSSRFLNAAKVEGRDAT